MFTGHLACCDRIQNFVDQLIRFSRRENHSVKEEIDIKKVIHAAIHFTRPMLKNSTKCFSYDLTEELPILYGNFQGLDQVFVNLILNACQALPGPSHGILVTASYEKNKNEIVVRVKDEGSGIDEKDQKNIMKPFFTTKKGTGTGLGLFIADRIIHEQHSGRINFESKSGEGTTVSVFLPVVPPPVNEKKVAKFYQ